ncbi:MAG: zf-HC2 domain-containing protein [Gemmatimonadales bacterium]
MQHIDEGTIHAWLDGALPPDEAATVEAHVRSCASCAAAVAEARGMIAGVARIVSALDVSRGDGLPRTPSAKAPAKPAAAGSMWRRLHLTPSRAALAAAILVAVAGTLVVQHQRPLADVMSSARRIDSSPVRPVDVSPSRPVNSPRVRTSAADPVAAPVPAPASATPAPTPAP